MARRSRATVKEAADIAREALLLHARKRSDGDDRLGDLLIYDLTPGFKVSAAKANKAFEAAGLVPGHILPLPPDWPVAFGRALEIVGQRIRAKDYRLMDAKKDNGTRRVGILAVARNGKVTTDHEATVSCPSSTDGGAPYVENGTGFAREIAQAILDVAEALHEVYTTDDIRTAIVQHLNRWYGLPLRRQPPYVAYWIPAAGGDEIRKLRDVIESLGAGEIQLMTGYASDPDSKRMAVSTVNKGLESSLNEFKAEVEKYTTKPADTTRASTIEAMIEDAKHLREQGALYREILGAAVESVEADYKKIEKTLRKHLGIVEEAHADDVEAT